jgi:hypothetical protein
MNAVIAVTLILNMLFAVREFFAVWDHISLTKYQGKIPPAEDYFEFVFAGVVISFTFFAFCCLFFR